VLVKKVKSVIFDCHCSDMKSISLLLVGLAVLPPASLYKQPAPISKVDPLELSSFYDYVPQPG